MAISNGSNTPKRGPKPGTPKAKAGGNAVKEKYGEQFFRTIGKKGGEAVKEKLGSEFYTEIGNKGGTATKARHGVEFYQKIGKVGGTRGRGTPKTPKGA